MGLRLTRFLSSVLFDVWGDIFCVSNLDRFLHSSFSRLLSYLRLCGSRATEAVEVVANKGRSSGTMISWEYFFEVYLQDRWEEQYGDEVHSR